MARSFKVPIIIMIGPGVCNMRPMKRDKVGQVAGNGGKGYFGGYVLDEFSVNCGENRFSLHVQRFLLNLAC